MCGLAIATVGLTTNVAGVFFTPMAGEFEIMRGSAALTTANVSAATGSLITQRLADALGARTLLVVFGALLAGSHAGIALAPSILVAYLCSAVRGLSVGVIGFVFIVYVLDRWFQERLGS